MYIYIYMYIYIFLLALTKARVNTFPRFKCSPVWSTPFIYYFVWTERKREKVRRKETAEIRGKCTKKAKKEVKENHELFAKQVLAGEIDVYIYVSYIYIRVLRTRTWIHVHTWTRVHTSTRASGSRPLLARGKGQLRHWTGCWRNMLDDPKGDLFLFLDFPFFSSDVSVEFEQNACILAPVKYYSSPRACTVRRDERSPFTFREEDFKLSLLFSENGIAFRLGPRVLEQPVRSRRRSRCAEESRAD